jgi:signal transduction histidine kinase
MPSPRTDDPGLPRATLGSYLRRLNVRLVLALSAVALVGLLVSGLAINQILPGFFAEQSQQRIRTAVVSTGIQLRQEIARRGENDPGVVSVAELRDRFIVPDVANTAAQFFAATVTIYNQQGQLVATATPEIDEGDANGLARDPEVQTAVAEVDVELPQGVTRYRIEISDPFTTRQATLNGIRGALIGAGLIALLVSVVTGVIAARRLTVPIYRLRRVAGKLAQGELDERASPSGVLETDELAEQFNVMADRLAGTLRMLQADRDRLREFVADVSHELRTPIAALRTFTELQREGDVDEATRTEFLDRSSEQISRLEWLSTNLLDLSRIDSGIFPLDMREGDLRDPIRSVVEAHAEVAEQREIELRSEVPGAPVELRFDQERMVQLLTNLVGNALKFTPGGGTVSVHLADGPQGATVEVRDTGIGIPADELPHIFDRFYRGTNTGEARATGSGLGLAIARSIVDMHGGTIEVASVEGEGSSFRIALPRVSEG